MLSAGCCAQPLSSQQSAKERRVSPQDKHIHHVICEPLSPEGLDAAAMIPPNTPDIPPSFLPASVPEIHTRLSVDHRHGVADGEMRMRAQPILHRGQLPARSNTNPVVPRAAERVVEYSVPVPALRINSVLKSLAPRLWALVGDSAACAVCLSLDGTCPDHYCARDNEARVKHNAAAGFLMVFSGEGMDGEDDDEEKDEEGELLDLMKVGGVCMEEVGVCSCE